jgi:hypothetical protein
MGKTDLAKTQEIKYTPAVMREVWPEIYQRQSPAKQRCLMCRGRRFVAFGRYCPDCGGFGFVTIPPNAPATLSMMALAIIK